LEDLASAGVTMLYFAEGLERTVPARAAAVVQVDLDVEMARKSSEVGDGNDRVRAVLVEHQAEVEPVQEAEGVLDLHYQASEGVAEELDFGRTWQVNLGPNQVRNLRPGMAQ